MEKQQGDFGKALIAIVLSFIVLIGYQYFFGKSEPTQTEKPKEEAVIEREVKADTAEKAVEAEVDLPETSSLSSVKVETPLFSAEISSRGAVIKKWTLKTYVDKEGLPVTLTKSTADIFPLSIGKEDLFDLSRLEFGVVGNDLVLDDRKPEGTLSFIHSSAEGTIKRTLTFHADTYRVDVVDQVSGFGNYWLTLGEDFGISGEEGFYTHIGPVTLIGTDRDEIKPGKIKAAKYVSPEGLQWIALEDKYFFSGVVPGSEVANIKIWKKENTGLIAVKLLEGENRYVLYAGPKVIEELKASVPGLEHIVDFGFWSFIARPIFWLLLWINGFINNYGWSIIVLTIVIRIPFIPLLNKGQKSMKKMQAIQPLMQELKVKYKNDSQKMQKEMMALYKKHKVNPMGGCLPMLIQIPVFFALYKVLLVAIEMRGAPWALWITDLSVKDPYYVLPIVMGASMFLQQKMTPTSADPKQAKIMMLMPVIFTFMFLNFSSGLVLYWLMSNVLSIVQQIFVNRKVAAEQAASQ
ncbi:MAG: membrane protein insertase YidC [Nitrospirota bacterium]|nr:MAG: membrane protein insertase YidC [Nitrospirota bacterium]